MIRFEALTPRFGVAAFGVDLAKGVSDEDFRKLVDALYENRVLVIKNQSCDKQTYLDFGRRWGRPIPHVLDHLRMAGFPEMLEIGNTPSHSVAPEVRNGAAFWHTDQSYDTEPAMVTMLYAQKVPAVGGETRIADMCAAYDDLDDSMKARLNGMEANHFYGAGELKEGEHRAAPLINPRQAAEVPPICHPIVRPHSVTGRKALYAVAGTAYDIEGLDSDAATELLITLRDHATQQRYVYEHKYEVGDIAIWDTQLTLHAAKPIDLPEKPEQERLLWRISVRGTPGVYAHA